jgi:hypothetical protein
MGQHGSPRLPQNLAFPILCETGNIKHMIGYTEHHHGLDKPLYVGYPWCGDYRRSECFVPTRIKSPRYAL